LIPCCLDTSAQKPLSPTQLSWHTSFITHAPVLLPSLLDDRQFDAMKNFLGNWRNSQYPSQELIFGAEALLAIETGAFSSYLLPCDCLFFLSDYARELKNLDAQGGKFRYYLKLDPPYTYDATIEARSLILFLRTWAQNLLQRPGLNQDELFLCRTLAGEIPDPNTEALRYPASCPRIAYTRQLITGYNNSIITGERNGRSGTASVSLGWWAPTGNLARVLGSHPSVGFTLGGRNKAHEFDVTWAFRFLHPTPEKYTVLRKDTAYSSNYYDGGYIGFEYTRYIVHQRYLDVGLTGGLGYDYFDIADGFGNNPSIAWLEPFNIGSLDLNYGLRIKYFFKNTSFIGLTVKYNAIYYENQGGTSLDGNAFTMDLSYGTH
jgi:hypothetical protein